MELEEGVEGLCGIEDRLLYKFSKRTNRIFALI